MRKCILFLLLLMLCGCSKQEQYSVRGFLTIDGNGLSQYPFSTEADTVLQYPKDYRLQWTAMPVTVQGEQNKDGSVTVKNMIGYTLPDNAGEEEIVYASIIQSGYQEQFEDLWCLVYDRLNGINSSTEYLDGSVLQNILQLVYQDDRYGNLRDIVTDCLMVVKSINDGNIDESLNEEAGKLYNNFYTWLCQFSIDKFQ